MSDAAKVDPAIREKLWENVRPHFSHGTEVLLGIKGKQSKEDVLQMLKLAYQAGVDRGYDMGHKVFGDGE